MSQTEFRKYILSTEFKELLKRFEDSRDTGKQEFFDVDELIDIAEYYNIQKDLTRTIETAEYCIEQYPDDQMAIYMLARLSLSEYKDADRAESYLSKIDKFSDTVEATLLKAEIQLVRGNINDAISLLKEEYTEIQESTSDDSFSLYGDTCYDEDEGDVSKDTLEEFPLEAAMLLCDYGQFSCAEEWMNMHKAAPKEMLFEYWETWGRIFHATGRLKEAINAFNLAIDDDAYSVITWIQLCDAQFQLALTDDVLQSTEYILALSPDNEDGLAYKGYCMMEKARYDEAMACFDKLEELLPKDTRTLIFKASILLRQEGDTQLAQEKMLEALKETSWFDSTISDIAKLLCEIGYKDAAYLLLIALSTHAKTAEYDDNAMLKIREMLTDCYNYLCTH